MDPRRLQLQAFLQSLLPDGKRAYFQPPANTAMVYPCIVYELDNDDVTHANNKPYSRTKRWQVTYIDANPDADVPDQLARLPMCSQNRRFRSDNLNHTVFSLFF